MFDLLSKSFFLSYPDLQENFGINNNGRVRALYSYSADEQDELSFECSEELMVLKRGDATEREWWWAENMKGETGYIPRNLLGVRNINLNALIRSLSNDDGDGNKNGKKAVGLDYQNNNFARASRFFVLFLAVVAHDDHIVKAPNFTFCRGREHKTTTFFFLFLSFDTVL